MRRRLYVLGLDGFSFDFVAAHRDALPTLDGLMAAGEARRLDSIFPPDSIPAWITIYTGAPPAEHGVLDSIDYLDPRDLAQVPSVDAFRGRTFWDEVSRRGRRVCVVNPFLAYPPWPVNGFFVNGSVFSAGKTIAANDAAMMRRYPPPVLGGSGAYPGRRQLPAFLEESRSEAEALSAYARRLHREGDFDLFFVTYLTMDRVQHFLWRYADPGDPTHPRGNPLRGALLGFYRMFDRLIAEIRDDLGPDEALLVLSDHGHRRRCPRVLNLNEVLRRRGYFRPRLRRPAVLDKSWLAEKAKNLSLSAFHRLRREDWLYALAKRVPSRRKLRKGGHIRSTQSVAEAWTLTGTVPFGGVVIHRENLPAEGDYERVRSELAAVLGEYRHGGLPVFRWVARREDVHRGPRLDKFADLLFEMDPDFGVDWALFGPEVGWNTRHRKVSGGHDRRGLVVQHGFPDGAPAVAALGDVYGAIVSCVTGDGEAPA